MPTIEFTPTTSPFPDDSVLVNALSGAAAANVQSQQIANQYAPARNQLFLDQGAQGLGQNEMGMVGRIAGSLLQLPDENARAAAYPGLIADARANGFKLPNAPDAYPGEAATRAFAARALTVPEQYQYGLVTAPGFDAAIRAATAPLPGQPGYGGPAAGGGAAQGGGGPDPVAAMPREQALDAIAQRESAGKNVPNAQGGDASGYWQIRNATWQEGGKLAGLDVSRWPRAMDAPWMVQRQVAGALYDKYGATPWAASNPGRGAQTAAAPPQPPAGGAATPAPYKVATTGAIPPPPSGGAPAGSAPVTGPMTDEAWLANQAQSYPGLAGPNDTSQAPVPKPAAIAAPPAAPPAATAAASPPPSPQNPLAPPPAAAPPAAPPAATRPPLATGLNSPQAQAALELNRRAAVLEAQPDPTGRLKAVAAGLRAQAQIYMQADSVSVDPVTGVQTHTLTGKQDDPAKPLPNYQFNPNAGGPGIAGFVDATGTNKPEIVPAQRADAEAQQLVMTLGPKVAAGTATPQEQASYAIAAETYRHPTIVEDPISKARVRVYERNLPSGFPDPSAGGQGAPGTQGGSGGQQVTQGLSPAQQQVERDPAAYTVAETNYKNDAQDIRSIAEAGRQAQADQVRIKEMQDVLQRFSTGPGTDWRTAASSFLQRWLPSAVTGWEKESANLSGSDAAQAFSKLALVGAGTQERGVLGARGGYQAIKLFKEANPNIDLQDATNKSILDMQLISNQANQDYTQAALSHFADNETKFQATHKYDSLNRFDRDWNAQRNPEVYSAAMGAISGQPASQWSKGLSDDEYKRALDIVSRASPSAVVQDRNGNRISMQPGSQAAAPVTVKSDADFNALPSGALFVGPDGQTRRKP